MKTETKQAQRTPMASLPVSQLEYLKRRNDAHDALTARVAELEATLKQIANADYGTDTPKLRATARAILAKGQV